MRSMIPLIRHNQNLAFQAECLHPTGSYKDRGVLQLFESLREVPRLLSTVSAGNLGRSLAHHCQQRGYVCRVYVPESAPEVKKNAIRSLGAELRELPFSRIWDMLRHPPAEEPGEVFVHPIRTPELGRGYGAVVSAILAHAPDTDSLVIPFGLGGLFLACQEVAKLHAPGLQLIAAEPDTAPALARALEGGRPVQIQRKISFIDAAGSPEILPEVYAKLDHPACQEVSLPEARAAMRMLLQNHGVLVEGAAGVAAAAALRLSRKFPEKKFVALLTGRNLDPALYPEILIEPASIPG